MAEQTIQVTEQMADFIMWANEKGEDEIRRIIRDHLAELKAKAEATNNWKKARETGWDDALEPNDGNEQWKHGGDCNLCRRADYCQTRCRANKLLKSVTTPFLYQAYLADVPEAAAKYGSSGIDNEKIMKELGVLQ